MWWLFEVVVLVGGVARVVVWGLCVGCCGVVLGVVWDLIVGCLVVVCMLFECCLGVVLGID